ncbi:MAG: MarR family transcriptional regulator, partial [Candidatus Nanohaloarchaea archaeon]|nr:MarR family transcriptional regulator [Candidatus Nanohaloarchaea archaeon]
MPPITEQRTLEDMADISAAKLQIIDTLDEAGGDIAGIAELGRRCGVKRQTAKEHVEELERYGLVERVEDRGGPHLVTLTRTGYRVRSQMVPEAPDTVDEEGPYRPHYVTAVLRVRNWRELEEVHGNWRRKWVEQRDRSWVRGLGNDGYTAVVSGVLYRIHRESIVVTLKHPVRSKSVTRGMNRAMARVRKGIKWIKQETPCRVAVQEWEVATTHVAKVRDYLAEYVENREGLELSDFSVVDEETGKTRLDMDRSQGPPELESKGAETAEEDMRFLEEFYS